MEENKIKSVEIRNRKKEIVNGKEEKKINKGELLISQKSARSLTAFEKAKEGKH